jgi:hypothetical protein
VSRGPFAELAHGGVRLCRCCPILPSLVSITKEIGAILKASYLVYALPERHTHIATPLIVKAFVLLS